jgi:hypothetical protein
VECTHNGFSGLCDVSYLPNSSIGHLSEDLINIVGGVIEGFEVKNTKLLWFVKDIVKTMNSDKVL